MDSFTRSKVWSLQFNLSRVQAALIDCGMIDREKKIRESVEVLRYCSLLMDQPEITTITGAQGVGKSYHVNQMFQIPDEQRLLSALGRCEKIPVFLFRKSEDNDHEVRVLRRGIPSEIGSFEYENIGYDDARKRVASPKEHDFCMFWYVEANTIFDAVAPVAVLPGYEMETPWEVAINVIQELSDSIIYVTDQSKSASETSAYLEEKISRLNLRSPAVVLLSKTDSMSDERKKQFTSQFPYVSIPVGIVDESLEKEDGDNVCTQQQYDKLFENLGEYIAKTSRSRKNRTIENTVDSVLMYLRDARDDIENMEVTSSIGIQRAIDSFVEDQDEMWNNMIKPVISEKTKAICTSASSEAYESAYPIIQGECKKRIKLWWNGGVTLGFTKGLQTELTNKFIEGSSAIEHELVSSLSSQSAKRTDMLLEMKNNDFEDLVKTGRELILIDSVITPLQNVDKKVKADLVQTLKSSTEALKQTGELVNEAVKISESVQPVIKAIADDKGKAEIYKHLKHMENSGKSAAIKSVTTVGIGAGGAAVSAAEVAGAGFAGATMSVVAGVLGAAVGAIAVGGWLMSITRSANRTEFMLDDFARKCSNAMSEQIQRDVVTKLDRFWEVYKYELRTRLISETGLNDSSSKILQLAKSTNDAIKDSNALIKSLGLAYED